MLDSVRALSHGSLASNTLRKDSKVEIRREAIRVVCVHEGLNDLEQLAVAHRLGVGFAILGCAAESALERCWCHVHTMLQAIGYGKQSIGKI